MMRLMSSLSVWDEERIFNPTGKKGRGTFVAVCFAWGVGPSLDCHGDRVIVGCVWNYFLMFFLGSFTWRSNVDKNNEYGVWHLAAFL
jgi:hypothetical protein